MNLSEVLVIGCGGCGNRLINTLVDMDIRVSSIFMNTNMNEMENLENFRIERGSFYISNADGCGKDRSLSEKYIKQDASKFAEMIVKYPEKYVVLLASMDGGTGSKAITMLPKIIKKYCGNKSINIISVFPNVDESELSFENCIDTWNELLELKSKGIIDSFQFIDNNKGSELDVNEKAMRELMDSLGNDLVGNKIDGSDIQRVHTCKGYKVILKLDENIKDVSKAIDKAIKDSYYFMPDNFECDVIVGNINTVSHNLKEVKDKFEAFDFSKFNEKQEGDSIILLGGCEMPTEPIQLTKECLKEVRKRKRERVVKEDLFVKINRDKDEDSIESSQVKSKLSSKDLKDMFKDDSFWD